MGRWIAWHSPRARCRLRGWLFLARLSETCDEARDPGRLVGGQAGPEQGPGSNGDAGPAQSGLEGAADLGVRSRPRKPAAHGPARGPGAGVYPPCSIRQTFLK